jgi:protein-S-isoprenylcysteine O-methyltransferase Ste14
MAAPAPSRPVPANSMRRCVSRAIAIIYGLVMFEVVIMISPFAFYFYAAYGPTLKWLNHSIATAWLTGFLLPHSVITTSPFLEFLRWDLGRYAFGLGLLAFLVFALQIYGSRLFGRKVVTSGVYRYIRHPQYLFLSVSAFGLFTMWPRMIIFLLFIGMLLTYYLLARAEERRMLIAYPEYAEYMRRTGMFLPGNPGGRVYELGFGRMRDQRLARRVTIGASVLVLLLLGFGLRWYTLRHVSRTNAANVEIVSVYPMESEEMQSIVATGLADPRVQEALQHEAPASVIAHILPHDYGMVGMFADIGSHHMVPGNHRIGELRYLWSGLLPFLDRHQRTDIMGSPGLEYRVVFSRVDGPDGLRVLSSDVFRLSAKMTPLYVADVNASRQVSRTIAPPRRSFWGDVKMPIF